MEFLSLQVSTPHVKKDECLETGKKLLEKKTQKW